jgi:hypothetical protein
MRRLIGLLFFAVFCLVRIHAQTGNDQGIKGTVSDSAGAAIPNAVVTIVNQDTKAERTATTNGDGNYVVPNLQPGMYTVSTTSTGFKKFLTQNVKLDVGQQLVLDLPLTVGDVSETVEVKSQAIQIETGTSEVSHLIGSQEVAKIQLNGRNFVQLVSLAPGVSTVYSSGFNLMGPYGIIGAAQSVNGSRPPDSSFIVDGIDNKDPGGPTGSNFVNITPDAIAEFRNVAMGQGAQYGSNAGPTISIAMKSGTQDLHGTAYDYFRNDAIQAHSLNAATKPKLRYNNFGWTLGGPVFIPKLYNAKRDKFFIFAGQDFKRAIVNNVILWTVPTIQNRNGNFSNLPVASQPKNPVTGVSYGNGIIPTAAKDSNGLALINLLPKPNYTGAGGNYSFLNPSGTTNDNEYFIKSDYNLTAKDQLAVHWLHDAYVFPGGPTVAISWTPHVTGLLSDVHWTHIFNDKTVNSFLFSWSGNTISQKNDIVANSRLGLTDLTRAGNGLTYPTIYNASPDIPQVQIAGYTTLTAIPFQFSNSSRFYDFKDDFSRILGNHSLKAGVAFMRSRKNQDQIPPLNGQFVFATSRSGTTGNALADAEIGNYYTYTEGSALAQGWLRYTDIEPYVQDDWTVSKRLTINYGLRWTYSPPVYQALGNAADFLPQYFDPTKAPTIDPKTGAITSAPGTYNPYNGLVLPGNGFPDAAKKGNRVPGYNNPAYASLYHNLPSGFASTQWGLFAPRAGFAYNLYGQKTVLRGAYALLYERIVTTYPLAGISQPPFVNQSQIFNGVTSNPAGASSSIFPSNITVAYPTNFRQPPITNYSLGIQQQFTRSTLVEVGYAGSNARHLTYFADINQLQPGTLQAHPGVNANALRPYKGYGDIYFYGNDAIWNYNALQAQMRQQIRGGSTFQLSYTWAKNLTNSQTHNYNPQNSYNIAADYGPAYFQRPQVLTASYVYVLPFWVEGKDWYKKAFGGWTASGVTNIESGLPMNVTVPTDFAGIGINNQIASTNGLPGFSLTPYSERASLIGNPRAGVSGKQFLNPAAFANPAAGTFGNLASTAIKGPLFDNWDISAEKKFPITDHVQFLLRGEAFNFPNHFSYDGVQNVFGQANFGQVVSASDPRTFEFAGRISF